VSDQVASSVEAGKAETIARLRALIEQPPASDADDPVSDRDERPDHTGGEVARQIDEAHDVALRRLSVRARTEQEMREDLARRDVPAEAIDVVVGRLIGARLIDDAAFARAWVEERRHRKGLSRARLWQELRRKGVDDQSIAAALETLGNGGDEEAEVALEAARRRVGALRGLDAATAQRRLAGYLARRGFSPAVARRATQTALGEIDDEPGDG
jgi:regulatory protein